MLNNVNEKYRPIIIALTTPQLENVIPVVDRYFAGLERSFRYRCITRGIRLFDRQPLMSRSKSRLAVILYRRCKFALFVFDIQYDLDGSPLETIML